MEKIVLILGPFWSFIFPIFILFLSLSSCTVENHAEPPNLILIVTDDQRWDALGHAGNEIISTPAMDALAKDGYYFKNAFVTTPICAASRASILTGLYERTHGYTFGQGALKPHFIDASYPNIFKGSNYYSGFFGKLGVNIPSADTLFDEFEQYNTNGQYSDRRGYFYKTINQDTVHLTQYTGHKAREFIKNSPEDQPFVLSLSFSAPHAHDPSEDQYYWPEYVDSLYRGHEFSPPVQSDKTDFEAQPPFVASGFNRTRWYWRFDTPEKYQSSMRGYYRMISGIDHQIALIRQTLEEKNLADNTVIVLMGDNGYFLGERQFAGKWLAYEPSIRVPLIIYDPRSTHSQTVEEMALNIDLAPTLLTLAGIDVPSNCEGTSLLDANGDIASSFERSEFLVEHLWDFDHIPPSEGLRTERWKYFRYIDYPSHEELYDLSSDPGEIKNLAIEPSFNDTLVRFRNRLNMKISDLEVGTE